MFKSLFIAVISTLIMGCSGTATESSSSDTNSSIMGNTQSSLTGDSSSAGQSGGDADSDGIADGADLCMHTPAQHGVTDGNGCSAIERGKLEYVAQCEGCHGVQGEGGFGGAINGVCQFTNCQDLAVLTEYLETDMPWKGAQECSDTNGESCASDVALFMHDQIVSFIDFAKDNDNDGLIDAQDNCPNTAAHQIKAIDANGCAQNKAITQIIYAINTGGAAFTAADGQSYLADTYRTGGTAANSAQTIVGTPDQELYRRTQFGNFSYALPVTSGSYQVTLLLAEVYWTEAAKRIFDVLAEGQLVVDDLDVWSYAGGSHIPKKLVLKNIQVSDGQLDLQFKTVVNNALLSGLQVARIGNDGDADGVLDTEEQCPGSPAVAVDAKGCALSQLDSDNDGISDDLDSVCPNTPSNSPVDLTGPLAGCSAAQKIADSDNDGVKDIQDRCLNSEAGGIVDDEGCGLLNTLSIPKGFKGQRLVNGIEFNWQAYATPVDYWIVQRWDESLSQWQTLGRVNGSETSFQNREGVPAGRFQLYAVTDGIASFPAQFVAGAHDLTIVSRNYGGSADNGLFEYMTVNGDFDARITVDIPNAGTLWRWERGGLMARESLDAGSRHIGVWVAAGVAPNGTKRDRANEDSENYVGPFGTLSFPKTVRLTREGNLFTWYEFRDNAWRKISSQEFTMPAQTYLGLPSGSQKRITIHYSGFQVNRNFVQSLTPVKFGVVTQADVVNHSDIPLDDSVASRRPSIDSNQFVHITANEYKNFAESIFPGENFDFDLSTDDSTSGYDVGANISLLSVERYQIAAEKLSQQVAAKLATESSCDFDDGVACLTGFIKTYGQHFYRRPLRQSQIDDYLEVYAEISGRYGKTEGVRAIIEALAQSPQFLYKIERAPDEMDAGTIAPVTGYEMAARLAAVLWSSVPDEQLIQAAASGRLVTPQQIKQQAQRMVNDNRARKGFLQFYRQWLKLAGISKISKDTSVYPAFNQQMAEQLEQAAIAYVDHIVFSGNTKPTIDNLLSAPLVAAHESFNFITGTNAGNKIEVMPSSAPRSGLLGQPGLLAMLAHSAETSIVLRGVYVNEQLLCEHFKAPPADVPEIANIDKAGKTAREVLDELTSAPACSGCHNSINPVGGAFERFDALGGLRDTDNGITIDDTATLLARDSNSMDDDIEGLDGLNKLLANMDQVKACVAQQYLNYSAGRIPGRNDSKSVAALFEAMRSSGWDIQKMMVEMTQTDMFLYQKIQ